MDWGNLPFGYFKTDYNVRTYYRNGKWGELEISSSEYIPLHIAATALHYGQEAFEGLRPIAVRTARFVCSVGRRTPSGCAARHTAL